MKFSLILRGLLLLLRIAARLYPAFRMRLAEKSFTALIRTKDGKIGRWFTFGGAKLVSGSGLHPDAQVVLSFQNAKIGARLWTGWNRPAPRRTLI